MPKQKTNRSAKKRFKLTAKGKVKRPRAGKSHLMASFSGKRVRKLRKTDIAADGDAKVIRKMLLAD
ncbi:MAG: 50S ribosomal protein L35 [Planctomycetota bacterium]|nr:50S ribosomal protein L35 [Planctomycetota bacterium]MEE2712069.1 50S ribosomal protein L35 [Planctomycetota bacterium]